jgi:hypothetical protein
VSPSRLALAVTTVLHAVRTLPIGSALRRVSPPATLLCNLALRLVSSTTMASADFCHSCSSLSASDAPAVNGRRERQISPGNDTLLHCTAAAFTFTAIPEVFGVLCHLDAPCRPSMRFLFISSQLSPSLPSRVRSPSRAWLQMVVSIHFWYSYRGLEPRLQRTHAGHTQDAEVKRGPRRE